MALKIRLRQQGRKNARVYRLVVATDRCPRDGKYVECLGWYNPRKEAEEQSLSIKSDRVQHWLSVGAEYTEKVAYLLKKGVPELIKQHKESLVVRREKNRAKQRSNKKQLA